MVNETKGHHSLSGFLLGQVWVFVAKKCFFNIYGKTLTM